MKPFRYDIDSVVVINDSEWRVAEYRMGRGSEIKYTLAKVKRDGSLETMLVNEDAIDKIKETVR